VGRHRAELPDREGNAALPHPILAKEDRAGIVERVQHEQSQRDDAHDGQRDQREVDIHDPFEDPYVDGP
jgi:hypothetical protein